jgi:hypothetical protein
LKTYRYRVLRKCAKLIGKRTYPNDCSGTTRMLTPCSGAGTTSGLIPIFESGTSNRFWISSVARCCCSKERRTSMAPSSRLRRFRRGFRRHQPSFWMTASMHRTETNAKPLRLPYAGSCPPSPSRAITPGADSDDAVHALEDDSIGLGWIGLESRDDQLCMDYAQAQNTSFICVVSCSYEQPRLLL